MESTDRKPRQNKYAVGCAILASMSSALMGYDIGVMSGAQIYIKEDLKISDTQLEVLAGVLNLYALLGSAAAGKTSDWIGRRKTIMLALGIFFAGALVMGFANGYAILMVGRFVAGVGVGYAMMIAPVYTAELSPASTRGCLTSFTEVFVNIGILLGYVSNFAFSKLPLHLGWRFMLGVAAIPSIFLALGVLAMPESPRWLVMQGRLADAKRVLSKTSNSKEEAEQHLRDIKETVGVPLECDGDKIEVPKQNSGKGVWRELVINPTPSVRHVLMCCIGLHFFQQASGIDSVVLYSPRIFEKAGIKSANGKLLATVAVGFVKTIFILVPTFLLDRMGRRPLLLTSCGGMVVSIFVLGAGLIVIDQSHTELTWLIILCVVALLAIVAFFSIGMGPMVYVYGSEIFPLRLRAQGCGLGIGVNRVMSAVVSMTFISLYKAITIGGSFLLYGAITTIGFIYFYTLLPETKGQNLEDMERLFGTYTKWRSALKGLEDEKRQDNEVKNNPSVV